MIARVSVEWFADKLSAGSFCRVCLKSALFALLLVVMLSSVVVLFGYLESRDESAEGRSLSIEEKKALLLGTQRMLTDPRGGEDD